MRPAPKFILLLLAGAVPLSAALCDYHLTPASPEANLISVGWIADDGQDCAIRTKDGKSIGVEKVAFEGKTYWNAAIKREKSSGPVEFVVSASGKSEDRMLLTTLVTVSSARVVVATYDLQTGELCDEFKME